MTNSEKDEILQTFVEIKKIINEAIEAHASGKAQNYETVLQKINSKAKNANPSQK